MSSPHPSGMGPHIETKEGTHRRKFHTFNIDFEKGNTDVVYLSRNSILVCVNTHHCFRSITDSSTYRSNFGPRDKFLRSSLIFNDLLGVRDRDCVRKETGGFTS